MTLFVSGCNPNVNDNSNQTDSSLTSTAVPIGRLPDTVYPEHYNIELSIIPDHAQFSGHTEIAVVITQPTQYIWLHGNQLDVSQVKIQLSDSKTLTGKYQQVDDIGIAKISFEQIIPTGVATLIFDYTAPFNESLEGIYKVIDNNDAYAFTQFQATSARLAFPSFDEPRFKVPFDIALEVDVKHRAITNTPAIKETILEGGRKRIEYATTKPLPTYLIAFSVGELDEVVWEPITATALRETPLPLRGYATKGKGQRLEYALEHTAEILTNLESYFGIAYPYRKLDIIAVPDFQAGAMENAGAITYREQLILLDNEAPVKQKHGYAEVHAHELAHQWFGNLVTPVWWDDIWLNEAFATWMSYKIMENLTADGSYAQAKLAGVLEAMQHDSLVSARQIRQPIAEHGDISSAFDGITYEKGGAVLTMFERFVGAEKFKAGIQSYMQDFAFENADARDFIRAIADQREDLPAGTVEAGFFSFLEQPGTPLIELDWHCTQEKSELNIQVEVTQSRYLPLGSTGETNQQWRVPLCLAYDQTGIRQNYCRLIGEIFTTFSLPGDNCPSYIIPNADATGYYRWMLPNKKWIKLLKSSSMTDAELLSAANGLSAAYHRGDIDTAMYLKALPYLLASNNNEVVEAPMEDLRLIHNNIIDENKRDQFRGELLDLYNHKLAALRLEKGQNTDNMVKLRRTLVQFLVRDLRDENLRRELAKKAQSYIDVEGAVKINSSVLDINIREAALFAAVQELTPSYSLRLKEIMLSSRDALLREEILRALSGSNDEIVLKEMRALINSPQLRDNEINHIIYTQMKNPVTRSIMWQWLLDNADEVLLRLPAWAKGKFVTPAKYFCSTENQKQIRDALSVKLNTLEGGARALANTLEQIGLCAALVNRLKNDGDAQVSSAQ